MEWQTSSSNKSYKQSKANTRLPSTLNPNKQGPIIFTKMTSTKTTAVPPRKSQVNQRSRLKSRAKARKTRRRRTGKRRKAKRRRRARRGRNRNGNKTEI